MSFSVVLTCSFIWNIFFPILIFPETLYLFLLSGEAFSLSLEGVVTGRLDLCFNLLSVQCPEDDNLPSSVSPMVSVLWVSEMQVPLATSTRYSKGVPWVGYVHPKGLSGQQLQWTRTGPSLLE